MSSEQEYPDFPDVLTVNTKGSEVDYVKCDVAIDRELKLLGVALRYLSDELFEGDTDIYDRIYKDAKLKRLDHE